MSKTILVAALVLCLPAAAHAFPFSFNKATAEIMVEGCKDDGITLSPELAKAIVSYRSSNSAFTKSSDLLNVPGMTELMIQQLSPAEEEGDLRFNLSDVPGMKGY